LAELLIYYHPSECSSHRSSTMFFNKVFKVLLVQIDKWNASRLELNRNSCDNASKENLHFDHQSKQIFIFSSPKFRKEQKTCSPCFYRVTETLVEVWRPRKSCENTSLSAGVPTVFLILPNFHSTNLPRKSRENNLIALV